jgi:hypothetical protein
MAAVGHAARVCEIDLGVVMGPQSERISQLQRVDNGIEVGDSNSVDLFVSDAFTVSFPPTLAREVVRNSAAHCDGPCCLEHASVQVIYSNSSFPT